MSTQPRAAPAEDWILPPEAWPDVENLVTEDDTPVDNLFSEKQQHLLTNALYASWQPDRTFLAVANVGLFFAVKQPPLVPDVLVSLGVELPPELWEKSHRSYFVWEYGKPPDLVIEVVSNREGGEDTGKLQRYASIGVDYYAIFDPAQHLSDAVLRVYKRYDTGYVETLERWLPKLRLGLCLWEGAYCGFEATWLRWCDERKQVLPTGEERAKDEKKRAESAEQRAARLAAQLRALGIEPDT